jgi:hypothetical protein
MGVRSLVSGHAARSPTPCRTGSGPCRVVEPRTGGDARPRGRSGCARSVVGSGGRSGCTRARAGVGVLAHTLRFSACAIWVGRFLACPSMACPSWRVPRLSVPRSSWAVTARGVKLSANLCPVYDEPGIARQISQRFRWLAPSCDSGLRLGRRWRAPAALAARRGAARRRAAARARREPVARARRHELPSSHVGGSVRGDGLL